MHDVTQLSRAGDLVAQAEKVAGAPISILVKNAGIHPKKSAKVTPEKFQSVLTAHVCAVLLGMFDRKQGNILFTALMASLFGIPLVMA